MKFKVGDMVGIRSDLSLGKYYSIYLSRKMVLNKGKITKIIRADSHDDTYKLDIDDGQWWWSEDMLEPYIYKFTKSDLEDEDYCVLKNGDKAIKIGNYVVVDGGGISLKEYNNRLEHDYNSNYDIIRVDRPSEYKTIFKSYEILDSTEKRYLAAVIRPFRDKVRYIVKEDTDIEEQRITIYIDNGTFIECITLPHFKSETMYVGMEPKRDYTLEELGL